MAAIFCRTLQKPIPSQFAATGQLLLATGIFRRSYITLRSSPTTRPKGLLKLTKRMVKIQTIFLTALPSKTRINLLLKVIIIPAKDMSVHFIFELKFGQCFPLLKKVKMKIIWVQIYLFSTLQFYSRSSRHMSVAPQGAVSEKTGFTLIRYNITHLM